MSRAAHHRLNLPFIAFIIGTMCIIECIFLLISLIVSFVTDPEPSLPLSLTLGIALAIGGVLLLIGRYRTNDHLGRRDAMLTVALTWIVVSLIGALPLSLGSYTSNYLQAFFESVSGFTTTGSTTFTSLSHLPKSILFFRAIMQWQGGLGIVVFSLALTPVLGKDTGLLYRAEVTGIDHDRFMPRIKEVSIRLTGVYILLTSLLTVLLHFTPMSWFDAVTLAFTCVSTGGFTNYDEGIVLFNSVYTEVVLMIFMIIGSINMTLLYFALRGRVKQLFKDEQTRWFLGIILVTAIAVSAHLYVTHIESSPWESMRKSFFQIISLISTTGYIYSDYSSWGAFFVLCAIFVMIVCGSSGSTSGGLKVVRFVILSKTLHNEILHRIYPNRVIPLQVNRICVREETVNKVMGFFFGYLSLIFMGTVCLTFSGNDVISSFSACVSAIGNVGPAFGSYVFHFAQASHFDLIVLSFLMLAGRLEIFTLLSVFSLSFWKP